METRGWLYVAPQRIRDHALALPKCETWSDFRHLNLQRLARVFEFQGCIGFVGSGVSAVLGYPPWEELLPREKYVARNEEVKPTDIQWDDVLLKAGIDLVGKSENLKKLSALLSTKDNNHPQNPLREPIQPTQAIQLAEGILGANGRKHIIEGYLAPRFLGANNDVLDQHTRACHSTEKASPFRALLELPIRRFVTTNYDTELERVLRKSLGPSVWKESLSFEQNDQEKLAIFAVALASKNRNMVFHCHGRLETELRRLAKKDVRTQSTLVLTDADYNHWYLSRDTEAYTFQRAMEVILQSNPLLFVGYTISDADLLRTLRQANLRWESERIASNLFLFLRNNSDSEDDVSKMAKQIRLGVNLLDFSTKTDLTHALDTLSKECSEYRREWMMQPKVKLKSRGPSGVIMPRPSPDWAKEWGDPLFPTQIDTQKRSLVNQVADLFETHSVVALIGGPGSGKFLKACQFVHIFKDKFEEIYVFHSYNNDDLYSYLKRLYERLVFREKMDKPSRPVLVVINNIDLLLGGAPSAKWRPPNAKASSFLLKLVDISTSGNNTSNSNTDYRSLKVLITARSLDYPLLTIKQQVSSGPDPIPKPDHIIPQIELETLLRGRRAEDPLAGGIEVGSPPFLVSEVMFNAMESGDKFSKKAEEFHRLRWWLQQDNFGLVLAARYLDGVAPENKREELLRRIMEALQSNSSEMGTRVVRHIIRDMDGGGGRMYETLLWFLSCFNTPITAEVFSIVCDCCHEYMHCEDEEGAGEATTNASAKQTELQGVEASGNVTEYPLGQQTPAKYLQTFLSVGLVQQIGPEPERGQGGGFKEVSDTEFRYVVPPLVKRYFREIMEKAQERGNTREFGLHGLLSKGPFNSPGCSKKPRYVFDYFVRVSFNNVKKRMLSPDEDTTNFQTEFLAAMQIRAVLDILRSNFACNSVPLWGEFRDYIDMLSVSIDLLRNFAWATKDVWYPGDNDDTAWVSDEKTKGHSVVASADEMLHLYNELGLAYYQTGSVQDALRVWGLATDWRKVVSIEDREQGEMYNATLNAHLGTAYMQLGRMQTARECFERALDLSVKTEDPDLGARMEGMIARIDHFGGSVKEAGAKYRRVIARLGDVGNRRAESYFMRHLSALELRFGSADKAEALANKSMAIAASENAPDLIAFASELKGKICKERHDDRKALREYGIALATAEKLDIARLQIDILLGTGEIQLRIGDVRSARSSSLSALKKSNEHLLVLRQVRALILLGKVAHARSEITLARSILQHARAIAVESRFRLSEHDAREALAGLGAV